MAGKESCGLTNLQISEEESDFESEDFESEEEEYVSCAVNAYVAAASARGESLSPNLFEPEIVSAGEENGDSDDSFEDVLPPNINVLGRSRMQPTAWCACNTCVQMKDEDIENICCKEFFTSKDICEDVSQLLHEQICITQSERFAFLVLDKTSLEIAHVMYTMGRRCVPKKVLTKSDFRCLAYRQFLVWVFRFRLGSNTGYVIPSCVVNAIRQRYPEPSGLYKGYKRSDARDALRLF